MSESILILSQNPMKNSHRIHKGVEESNKASVYDKPFGNGNQQNGHKIQQVTESDSHKIQ